MPSASTSYSTTTYPVWGPDGLGYIHLIGGYARAGTSLIRQLIDAGTLANLPGGLKSRGLRIKGDDTPIAPGEYRDVDVPSGSIRDNIMPLPYKEPSMVLSQLLDRITEEGRRLGSVADMKISDMSANAPVGTTLGYLGAPAQDHECCAGSGPQRHEAGVQAPERVDP